MLTSTEFPALPVRSGTRLRTVLNHVLIQESRLAAVTRDYVGRLRGSPLESIRRLLGEQGRQMDRWLREISTRVRGAETNATSPPEPAAEAHRPGEGTAPRQAAAELLSRHEAIIRELRTAVEALGENGTADEAALLNPLLEFHETSAWILRLLLESPDRARVI